MFPFLPSPYVYHHFLAVNFWYILSLYLVCVVRRLAFSSEGDSEIYKKSASKTLWPPYFVSIKFPVILHLWYTLPLVLLEGPRERAEPIPSRWTTYPLNRLKLYWNQVFLNEINTLSLVILWLPIGHQKFYDPLFFFPKNYYPQYIWDPHFQRKWQPLKVYHFVIYHSCFTRPSELFIYISLQKLANILMQKLIKKSFNS